MRSEKKSIFPFFLFCGWVGLPEEEGLQEPLEERLSARGLCSGCATVLVLFWRALLRRLCLSCSSRGDQSRSFFRWPRPHRQPHALNARSYPFFVHRFWCLCRSDHERALPHDLRYVKTPCSHSSKHSRCM